MKRQKNKYIQIRIPAKDKDIFYEQRELIKQEIDKILNQQKQFKEIEITYPYDERVSFVVDELYYEKLEELAKNIILKSEV